MDFDDDPAEAPASAPKSGPATRAPQRGPDEDVAPPKPPRPLAPEQQAENTLKEAFPSIDAAVVKAVLRASGGKVEPAFNALLGMSSSGASCRSIEYLQDSGMSDPDAAEPPPPRQPPRPTQVPTAPTSTYESQVVADERYARQLAEHYNGAAAYGGPHRSGSGMRRNPTLGAPRRGSAQRPAPREFDEEPERSWIDGTCALGVEKFWV